MRWCLVLLIACGTQVPPVQPIAPPIAIANATRSCADAAIGLERGTRGIRDPESSILEPMRTRCIDDGWPTAAIDCFAEMHEGDLGHCAGRLSDPARNGMFAVLGGGSDRTAIAVARARLELLAVGIAECDQFVSAVATVLTCEGMPIDARVTLGNETATFWDLPTHGLSADAQRRMANVCGTSLAQLQQQAIGLGCMP